MKPRRPETEKNSISIRKDLRPGDIGMVIHLHGVVYAEEQGWDETFDGYVAAPLAEFATSRSERERIWIVEVAESAERETDRRIVGSAAVVEASEGEAQLRWLLLAPEVRGLGLGRWLAEEAVEFSRSVGYSSIFLWTVRGLETAEGLYHSLGFEETEEKTSDIWGGVVTEVRYDLKL
jgi:GNAT superfamily N-acetyltransferase